MCGDVQRQIGDPLIFTAFLAVFGGVTVEQVGAAQHREVLIQGLVITGFGTSRNEKRLAVTCSTNGCLE